MVVSFLSPVRTRSYHGLRLTADQYFALGETTEWYELIDGVVCMSPSPSARHQYVAGAVFAQILAHVEAASAGYVLMELDVHLGQGSKGHDLVYRPDVMFIRKDRLLSLPERIRIPPDLVLEVVSASSAGMDRETKRVDYERAGVSEYWIIDPEERSMTFLRLVDGKYIEVPPTGDSFVSAAVPGFVFQLARVRAAFAT